MNDLSNYEAVHHIVTNNLNGIKYFYASFFPTIVSTVATQLSIDLREQGKQDMAVASAKAALKIYFGSFMGAGEQAEPMIHGEWFNNLSGDSLTYIKTRNGWDASFSENTPKASGIIFHYCQNELEDDN